MDVFGHWRVIDRLFGLLGKRTILAWALILEAAIFWIDYITSPYISFELYYFVPIAIAAWYIGPAAAYVVATLSSLTRAHVFGIIFPSGTAWLDVYDFLVNGFIFFLVTFLVLQIKRLVSELTDQSQTDYLTGIHNRRHFFETGTTELLRAFRYKYPLTLVYLDIDNFKYINDSHGHTRGDEVLADFAKAMQQKLRAGDILARMGGDEFAILLPHTSVEQARLLLERIRDGLQAFVTAFSPRVTLSIGVVVYEAGKPFTMDQLISEADRNMYLVKRQTKDAIRIAVV